jgi:hypothetical protein
MADGGGWRSSDGAKRSRTVYTCTAPSLRLKAEN